MKLLGVGVSPLGLCSSEVGRLIGIWLVGRDVPAMAAALNGNLFSLSGRSHGVIPNASLAVDFFGGMFRGCSVGRVAVKKDVR